MQKKIITTPVGSLNCPIHHRRLLIEKQFTLKKENGEIVDAQGLYCQDCNAIYVRTNEIPYRQGYIKTQNANLINCMNVSSSYCEEKEIQYIKLEKNLSNRSFCDCGNDLKTIYFSNPEFSALYCEKCQILYIEEKSFIKNKIYNHFNQPYILGKFVFMNADNFKSNLIFDELCYFLNVNPMRDINNHEKVLFIKNGLLVNGESTPIDIVVITTSGIYVNEKIVNKKTVSEKTVSKKDKKNNENLIPIKRHANFKTARLMLNLKEVTKVKNINSLNAQDNNIFKKEKRNNELVEMLRNDMIAIGLKYEAFYNKSRHLLYLSDYDYQQYKEMLKIKPKEKMGGRILSKEFTHYEYAQHLKNEDTIYKLQLIRSSNNHVTKYHSYQERIVNFGYLEDDILYRIKMLVYYCEDCDITFDFYESFLSQIKDAKLNLNNIILNFTDENYNPIEFPNYTLRERSKLKLFGYSVGYTGQYTKERHEILKFILDNKIMDSAEIKNHIEFSIRYNGKRSNMDLAIDEWKSDIEFVNNYVINKKSH